MEHLPKYFDLPKPGLVETVLELPSETDYYDGTNHLNVLKLHCTIYSNPKVCMAHSSCGWCGSSSKCIIGNNLGPQQPCKRSSYIYSAPYTKYDKQALIESGEVPGLKDLIKK